MSDSVGLAVQAGVDYWFNKQWGMFASIAKVQTKSDLVASGSTVIQTTIDFRPMVYSMGLNFRF
jgi:outer membrane protein